MDLAIRAGKLEIVKYFIFTHQYDPLVKYSNNRYSPIFASACAGRLDVLKFFVEVAKCDPNHASAGVERVTLLGIACTMGHLHIVQYLMETCKCDPIMLLHSASRGGHLDVVKYLVEVHHFDPLHEDSVKATPLSMAVTQGYLEVVRYFLVDRHCNPHSRDAAGLTCLHTAAQHGKLEVVRLCIEELGCDPNMEVKNSTPLHLASTDGHIQVVKYLVEVHHSNPLHGVGKKLTPVHNAAYGGSLDVLRYFADEIHCDLMCLDNAKGTPLHHAAYQGHLDVVRYLVCDHQCNPLTRDDDNKAPLHYAAMSGHLDIVSFFVKEIGVDPNITGQHGLRPLFYAICNGHTKVAKFLIDLKHCDVYSIASLTVFATPLYMAVYMQNLNIIKYLLKTRRIDPYLQLGRKQVMNCTNNPAILDCLKGYTDPLHLAASTGDVEIVLRYVDEEGWCPNQLDRHGNSTLHNAAQYGQLEVVKVLMAKGPHQQENSVRCDPHLKNKRGLMAHEVAQESGHHAVVSYLLRATTIREVSTEYALSPSINILVLGNSGSGKSTLVKALSQEKVLLGKVMKVKGVAPLTAGIIPSTLHSDVFGRVNIYDFAGHEEYYASHEIILQ